MHIQTTKRPRGIPSQWGLYKQKERRAILMHHHNMLMRGHQQEVLKTYNDKTHKETYEKARPGLRTRRPYEFGGAMLKNIMRGMVIPASLGPMVFPAINDQL